MKGDSGQVNSKAELHTDTHEMGPRGGTRAGLFRTPISGGVQSATSVNDLPKPALAVRNLMEQVIHSYTYALYVFICFLDFLLSICLTLNSDIKARSAHLCTVMSRMHQRSKGYPFGSLVDFAPDAMGRKF